MNTPHHGSIPKGDSRIADKFVVRMPDGMRDLIAQQAAVNHRSMNSEIIRRLSISLEGVELAADVENAPDTAGWTPVEGMLVKVATAPGVFIIRGFNCIDGELCAALAPLTEKGQTLSRTACPVDTLSPIRIK